MPAPKLTYVQQATGALLLKHVGKLYDSCDIASQLSIAADVDGNEDISIDIGTYILANAFRSNLYRDLARRRRLQTNTTHHSYFDCRSPLSKPTCRESYTNGGYDTKDGR